MAGMSVQTAPGLIENRADLAGTLAGKRQQILDTGRND